MSDEGAGIVTKTSRDSVVDTVQRFLELLATKHIKVFAVIDQHAEARTVGLDFRETTLVVFGNPAAGTPVMDAAPLWRSTSPSRSSSGPTLVGEPK